MRITQVRRSWVVFSEDQFFWSVAFNEDEISHILLKYYLVLARLNACDSIFPGKLPTTSYVKMVDIWLLFCLSVPFSLVLLNTWIELIRSH
jgi:hypothetical protein